MCGVFVQQWRNYINNSKTLLKILNLCKEFKLDPYALNASYTNGYFQLNFIIDQLHFYDFIVIYILDSEKLSYKEVTNLPI